MFNLSIEIKTKLKMCYQFMTYYPRKSKFVGCTSFPSWKGVNDFLQNLNE